MQSSSQNRKCAQKVAPIFAIPLAIHNQKPLIKNVETIRSIEMNQASFETKTYQGKRM